MKATNFGSCSIQLNEYVGNVLTNRRFAANCLQHFTLLYLLCFLWSCSYYWQHYKVFCVKGTCVKCPACQPVTPHLFVPLRKLDSLEDGRHKVLIYIEYRALSGVFRTIAPPPLHPASVSFLRTKGGGVYTRRAVRGWGVNISEDARHWIGLLQYNPSIRWQEYIGRQGCESSLNTSPRGIYVASRDVKGTQAWECLSAPLLSSLLFYGYFFEMTRFTNKYFLTSQNVDLDVFWPLSRQGISSMISWYVLAVHMKGLAPSTHKAVGEGLGGSVTRDRNFKRITAQQTQVHLRLSCGPVQGSYFLRKYRTGWPDMSFLSVPITVCLCIEGRDLRSASGDGTSG